MRILSSQAESEREFEVGVPFPRLENKAGMNVINLVQVLRIRSPRPDFNENRHTPRSYPVFAVAATGATGAGKSSFNRMPIFPEDIRFRRPALECGSTQMLKN